ncbi:hypothetical protein GN956_G7061 [Arapaima gigas]
MKRKPNAKGRPQRAGTGCASALLLEEGAITALAPPTSSASPLLPARDCSRRGAKGSYLTACPPHPPLLGVCSGQTSQQADGDDGHHTFQSTAAHNHLHTETSPITAL